MPEPRTTVRWPLIVGVTLVGLILTGAPFLLSQLVDPRFGEPQALTTATLTNIGTTFLLAAILFALERGFIKRVEQAAARSANRAVDERTADLNEANLELARQIESLKDAVSSRLDADAAEHEQALAHISEDVTFDSIAEAMERANDINALWHGSVTVPASEALDAARVTFDWRWWDPEPEDIDHPDTYPAIRLTAVAHDQSKGRSVASTYDWEEGTDTVDAVHGLQRALMKAGTGPAARGLDATVLFRNFQLAVSEAIRSRQGHPDGWIVGALHELVSDNLAVTDAGLSVRDGAPVASKDFPDPLRNRLSGRAERIKTHGEPDFPPNRPSNVTSDEWSTALELAGRYHPSRFETLVRFGTNGYQPIDTEHSPRQGRQR